MKIGTGILLVLAAVLLFFAARSARLMERLHGRFDALEARVKAPPPRLAAPPAAEEPAPRTSSAPQAPPTSAVEEAPAPDTSGFPLPELLEPRKKPPAARALALPELTPEQKKVVDGLLEAQRRERLQIDGDAAFRHRELDRRTAALIRAWLTPEQQRVFDESRQAPRPDGPLTPSAQDYIQKDPAPYDVEVEWGGEWWPARSKEVRGELTLIHYVGHGEEWHEWVGPERVRPKR